MRTQRLMSAILLSAIAFALASAPASAREDYKRIVPLLDDTNTVLDQPLSYPKDGDPRIQSVIVTMLPGEETGAHTHPYPTYGYVLEGELTVSYPDGVKKTYKQGEAVLEAVNTIHNGKNTGSVPVRILVVFMGVDGKANTLLQKKN